MLYWINYTLFCYWRVWNDEVSIRELFIQRNISKQQETRSWNDDISVSIIIVNVEYFLDNPRYHIITPFFLFTIPPHYNYCRCIHFFFKNSFIFLQFFLHFFTIPLSNFFLQSLICMYSLRVPGWAQPCPFYLICSSIQVDVAKYNQMWLYMS